MIEYRLLGPVEVAAGDRLVPIAGPRARTVLAALALDPGRAIPIERLVEAVWSGHQPATAHRQILICVSALRRALGGTIVTAGTGYTLAVRPHDVDLHVFESLAEEARELIRADRLDGAVARYREALALWRGPALGGVRGLAGEVVRLEERRLGVLEECLGAQLALGRYEHCVAELAGLVTAHPFREKPRAQLMRALYESGRRAEALAVYRTGRELLVAELGLEPGIELRELHAALLSDAGCGTPAPARTAATQPQRLDGPDWVHEPPHRLAREFFGVTMNSTTGAMPGFGIGAIRLWDCHLRWANIEPRRGDFRWQTLDRMVTSAERAGLPVLYTLGLTPAWANPGGRRATYADGSRSAPPLDLDDWDRYVRAIASRFRGRIAAYELWDGANSPYFFSGELPVLVEMVHRAARTIRSVDGGAIVVAPSFGRLWESDGRAALAAFAHAGGFEPCDVAAMKLHPRTPTGRPEEMIELAGEIQRTLHPAGVTLPTWCTGPAYDVATAPMLSAGDAEAFAARFFLAGVYARIERMYFYCWGSRRLPLVLQPEGGQPTRAARGVEELRRWLTTARVRSGGQGTEDGLPAQARQCRLLLDTGLEAAVRWTETGAALMTEPGRREVRRLDGSVRTVAPGEPVELTPLPVLVTYR